jgi:hypothetical protein
MSHIYPYTSAQILTDAIYVGYGGATGSSTVLQRNAAYFIAEKLMARNLSAFAPITTVTGTFSYPYNTINPGREIDLWWKYVQSVNKVTFIDISENRYYSVIGTDNIHVGLRNSEYGILDVYAIASHCGCVPFGVGSYALSPYTVEVVYNAGLPTGTYTSPDYLWALTTLADVMINEFGGCGNESSPFVGITKFSNQQYSETRMGMYQTTLGSSPQAMFAYNLVKDLQRYRVAGL